jgi:hypothetical protein
MISSVNRIVNSKANSKTEKLKSRRSITFDMCGGSIIYRRWRARIRCLWIILLLPRLSVFASGIIEPTP